MGGHAGRWWGLRPTLGRVCVAYRAKPLRQGPSRRWLTAADEETLEGRHG
jgi:hypothetical protein